MKMWTFRPIGKLPSKHHPSCFLFFIKIIIPHLILMSSISISFHYVFYSKWKSFFKLPMMPVPSFQTYYNGVYSRSIWTTIINIIQSLIGFCFRPSAHTRDRHTEFSHCDNKKYLYFENCRRALLSVTTSCHSQNQLVNLNLPMNTLLVCVLIDW